jgi:lipopolysaccharide biosynthesis glycosyltransferase
MDPREVFKTGHKIMKKDRAVVFTVSSNLTFSIACVCMDIKKISANLADEIVVFHDGITKKDQDLLNSILPTRFIEYQMPFRDISFIPKGILTYFTKMVFAKFECLKLLNDYHMVMLSDYDIVIQKDISDLFEHCPSGAKFMKPSGHTVLKQLSSPIHSYDMRAQGTTANLFVLQDHIGNYNKMYNFCYESLLKYADKLFLPEQAIFDLMMQEFNISPSVIEHKKYSPDRDNIVEINNAKILHAYGQPKFWNGFDNKQWNSNYAEWIAMGGSKYKKPTLLHRVTKKIRNKLSK